MNKLLVNYISSRLGNYVFTSLKSNHSAPSYSIELKQRYVWRNSQRYVL